MIQENNTDWMQASGEECPVGTYQCTVHHVCGREGVLLTSRTGRHDLHQMAGTSYNFATFDLKTTQLDASYVSHTAPHLGLPFHL